LRKYFCHVQFAAQFETWKKIQTKTDVKWLQYLTRSLQNSVVEYFSVNHYMWKSWIHMFIIIIMSCTRYLCYKTNADNHWDTWNQARYYCSMDGIFKRFSSNQKSTKATIICESRESICSLLSSCHAPVIFVIKQMRIIKIFHIILFLIL
jgi:hypothetical protein